MDHLDEKKRKYRSGNVSTHSRYTLETYFRAVIWLCLWQKKKIPPPPSPPINFHTLINYWCPWSSAVAGRADDVYSGCILSYDVQIVPYVTELSLPHSYVCLLCWCVRWNNLTNNGSILTFFDRFSGNIDAVIWLKFVKNCILTFKWYRLRPWLHFTWKCVLRVIL